MEASGDHYILALSFYFYDLPLYLLFKFHFFLSSTCCKIRRTAVSDLRYLNFQAYYLDTGTILASTTLEAVAMHAD